VIKGRKATGLKSGLKVNLEKKTAGLPNTEVPSSSKDDEGRVFDNSAFYFNLLLKSFKNNF